MSTSHTCKRDDGVATSVLKSSIHCDCDIVGGIHLQTPYGIAVGGNSSTSPTSSIPVLNSRATIAIECLPLHLIAGYHCAVRNSPGEGDGSGCN